MGNYRFIHPEQKKLIITMSATMTPTQISKHTGISTPTMYRILEKWRHLRTVTPGTTAVGRPRELTHYDFDHHIPFTSTPRTLAQATHGRERSEELRNQYEATIAAEYPPETHMYLDESHCNRHTTNRRWGWAPVGDRACRHDFFVRGTRYSILPAISLDGVLHLDIITKSWNTQELRKFVDCLLDVMNPYPMKNSVLIMDNASTHHRRAFSQTVYGLFNELHSPGLDPPTWSKRQATAGEYVCQQLLKQHREFRYCEDGKYKASLYASIKFPDWNRDSRQAGKLAERKPILGRHDTSFSTLPLPAPKRHRKQAIKQRKIKVETDSNLIDLSLDAEDTESEDHGHLHAPVPKKPSVEALASWQMPPSGSTTPPVMRTPPLDIPRSPTPVYEPPPAADHSNAASRAPTLAPPVSRPLTVPHAMTPFEPTVQDSPERPLASTHDELLGTDLGAINRPPRIREKPTRPRRVDNLAGLVVPRSAVTPPVPRPTIVLPPVQPITAATTNDDLPLGPSSDSPHAGCSSNLKFPPPPDARVTKKRTPVKPNGSSTRRNLYLMEYLQHHPQTTAQEFKVVWDTLVQAEVKQEYKRLASQAQASN